jgi:WD40 repeat protein
VLFSPGDRLLAAGGDDGVVRLWEPETGRLVHLLRGFSSDVRGLVFSPDGRVLAAMNFEQIRAWDVATGQTVHVWPKQGQVQALAFDAEGKQLLALHRSGLILAWDLASGAPAGRFPLAKGFSGSSCGALSTDGRLLAVARQARDGWEVVVCQRETQHEVARLRGLRRQPARLVFQDEARRVAACGPFIENPLKPGPAELRVWDVAEGGVGTELGGHTSALTAAAFAPGGKRLVSGGTDCSLRLWDTAQGKPVWNVANDSRVFPPITALAWAPDGNRLASAGEDGVVRLWEVASRTAVLLRGHKLPIKALAFSPDGRLLASGAGKGNLMPAPGAQDTELKVWETSTGREARTIPSPPGAIECVAFGPDSRLLLSAGALQGTPSAAGKVYLWDALTGEARGTLAGHSQGVRSAGFSRDGRWVVSGGDDRVIRIWDASTGETLRELAGHRSRVRSVAFSPDDRRIVSGSEPTFSPVGGEVKLWDVRTGVEVLELAGPFDGVRQVAFSPEGRRLLAVDRLSLVSAEVRIWDSGPQPDHWQVPDASYGLWSSDRRFLLTAGPDDPMRLRDVHTGKTLATLPGRSLSLYGLALSPDGRRAAGAVEVPAAQSGATAYGLRLWAAQTGMPIRTLVPEQGGVRSAAFSPDGQLVAAGIGGSKAPGKVCVWDVETGELRLTLEGFDQTVGALAFSPDGRLLATGGQLAQLAFPPEKVQPGELKLWEVQSGRLLRALEGHRLPVLSLAFSPDGKQLLAGTGTEVAPLPGVAVPPGPGELKLWDVDTGREGRSLTGYDGPITSVAFSPSGEYVAGAGRTLPSRGEVRIWRLRDGATVEHFQGGVGYGNVAFHPDGEYLLEGASGPGLTIHRLRLPP